MGEVHSRIINLYPVLCNGCNKIITTHEPKIMHHVSYSPEIVVSVHTSCHSKIHHGSAFPELRPSPKQLIRYYYKGQNKFLSNWNRSGRRKSFDVIVPKFFNQIENLFVV